MLWVGTRRPWRGGLKNCALPFDRIGAFQYNFPKATIFDSGVCEINARKKKRDKQPQSPPCPPLQCWMFSQATRTLQKRAFISQAHRPPQFTKTGVYFAGAPTPPGGWKHNIEMRGTGLVSNCARTCAGVYFADTGLEKEDVRYP